MEQFAYDFHIHSCLSPCADMEMTPNNLVNMAYIKELDAIAVADHNTAGNLRACAEIASERGLLFLPGLEAETREEVHVLCYFHTVDAAEAFACELYAFLPDIPNRPDFFGEQIAMNSEDEPAYTEPKLLIQPTTLALEEMAKLVRKHGGVPVPAHINRTSNSLLNNLGFIPPGPKFTSVELYRFAKTPDADLSAYHRIFSSDAHRLEDISERENFIKLPERSAKALLEYLASGK